MNSFRNLLPAARTFGAGALLGLPAITPVFAATGDDPITPQGMLLVGSVALLGIALALKAFGLRKERSAGTTPDAPDLRWWKNP